MTAAGQSDIFIIQNSINIQWMALVSLQHLKIARDVILLLLMQRS